MATMKLVSALAFAVMASGVSLQAHALGPRPGQDPVDWCIKNGGNPVQQPPGSRIQACCNDQGCVICDASWHNCTFDPAYNQNSGGLRPDLVQPGQMTQPGRGPVGVSPSMNGILASPFSR